MLRRPWHQHYCQRQLFGFVTAATLSCHPLFFPLKASFRSMAASSSLHLPQSLHAFFTRAAPPSSWKPFASAPTAAASSAAAIHQASPGRAATAQLLPTNPKKKKKMKKKKVTPLEGLTEFLQKVRVSHRVGWILKEMEWKAAAESAVERMKVQWDSQTVLQVLRYPLEVEAAWGFFCWLRRVYGYRHTAFTYSTMLEILGPLKDTARIQELIQVMKEDGHRMNVITHTRIMYWYGRAGEMEKALKIFDQMKALSCRPNIVTFTTLLDLHFKGRNFSKMREAYLEMVESGEQLNSAACTVLINCLVGMGMLDNALLVFDSMERLEVIPTFVTYGLLMDAFAKAGNAAVFWGLYERMHKSGVCLNERLYSVLVDSLHAAGKSSDAEDLLAKIGVSLEKRQNLSNPPMHSFREMAPEEAYCLQEVFHVFDGQFIDKDLEDPYGACLYNPSTEVENLKCNPRIDVRALCGVLLNWEDKAVAALEETNIKWDGHKVLRMLMALTSGDLAWRFFNWVKGQEGYEHNAFTYSKMIDILARSKYFKNAQVLLEEMQEKQLPVSVTTFNTLISCFSSAGNLPEALKLFYWMRDTRVDPNDSTYALLIDMFARHKRNDNALEMYKRMLEAGLRPDTRTYSSFIKSVAEDGKELAAYSIFQKMQEFGCPPDATIFAALIDAFYKKENMEKTLELYAAAQQSDIELFPATYRLVAKAFKRVGNMEDSDRIRKEVDLRGSSKQKRVDSSTIKTVHDTVLEALSKAEKVACSNLSTC